MALFNELSYFLFHLVDSGQIDVCTDYIYRHCTLKGNGSGITTCITFIVLWKEQELYANGIFEHTCAYAWWAQMHRFLSVRLSLCQSVTSPKFSLEIIPKLNKGDDIGRWVHINRRRQYSLPVKIKSDWPFKHFYPVIRGYFACFTHHLKR